MQAHFAPANDLTVPAAFAGIVQTVGNVSDFRPKAHVKRVAAPQFTSSQTSTHFLTPGDLATIYDIKAAYNAGYTGAGQSIAIAGQSAIIPSDVSNFQSAAGLTQQAPTMVLMPGTGPSTIYSDDESESDLDVEYSGGVAKGATIFFVYTGSSKNYGVFDALQYAIQNKVAPIVTVSYGDCETDMGTVTTISSNPYALALQQARRRGRRLFPRAGTRARRIAMSLRI